MIAVRDPQRRPHPPAWLAGADDLRQADSPGGIVWAICPAFVFPQVPDHAWRALPDGYEVGGTVDDADPVRLLRRPGAYRLESVTDLRGRAWRVPVVTDEQGDRAFAVSYGEDWMPVIEPEQDRALKIAAEARSVIRPDGPGAPIQAACAWSAAFLSLAYHLTPAVIQRAGIMDDALAVGIVGAACSLPVLGKPAE